MSRGTVPDTPEDLHHLLLPVGRLMTITPHGLTVFSLTSAGAELDRTLSLPELGLEGAVSRVAGTDSSLVMVDIQDTAVTLSLSSFNLSSNKVLIICNI